MHKACSRVYIALCILVIYVMIEFCLFMIVLLLKYYCFCGNISKRNRNCLVTGGCNMKGPSVCVQYFSIVMCSVLCCVSTGKNREKISAKFCIFPEIFPFFSQNGQIIRPF